MQVMEVQNFQSKIMIVLQKDFLQVDVALATQESIGGNLFFFLKLVDAIDLIQGENLQIEEQWKIT